jgi:hypothetical protein
MSAKSNPKVLDLERPRGVSEVIATTLDLFSEHFALFLSVTLVVVGPVTLLVDGVWAKGLANGHHAHHLSSSSSLLAGFLTAFVVPPLVTALHSVIVREMGSNMVPSVGAALRDAAPRFPAAFGAVVVYGFGVAFGFLLLIVPGIWLAARWYFAAQAAVIERVSPLQSLTVSSELVQGQWWRTFGALILSGLMFGGTSGLLQALVRLVHNGVAYTALDILVQATFISLTALFGTLLFFSWRASKKGDSN